MPAIPKNLAQGRYDELSQSSSGPLMMSRRSFAQWAFFLVGRRSFHFASPIQKADLARYCIWPPWRVVFDLDTGAPVSKRSGWNLELHRPGRPANNLALL